jgi:hypothetical protein
MDKIDFSGHFDEMPQNSFWPQVNFGKFTPHEINSLRLGERSEQDRSEQDRSFIIIRPSRAAGWDLMCYINVSRVAGLVADRY